MASLSIRKLDEETYDRLRRRAASQGHSMEEEARRILRLAVAPTPAKLGDFFVEAFGEEGGVELDLPARPAYEPIRFE